MTYRIEWRLRARKAFLSLDKPVRRRIGDAVGALAADPRPAVAKMITSAHGLLRITVGDYRVLYTSDEGQLIILVLQQPGIVRCCRAGEQAIHRQADDDRIRQAQAPPGIWARCQPSVTSPLHGSRGAKVVVGERARLRDARGPTGTARGRDCCGRLLPARSKR